MPVPRLRVFAGPKGSGKSTIKRILAPELIYAHVNADDLEREANDRGAIDLTPFKIDCAQDVFRTFFSQHPSKINRDAHGTESDRYPTCSALPSTPVFKSIELHSAAQPLATSEAGPVSLRDAPACGAARH